MTILFLAYISPTIYHTGLTFFVFFFHSTQHPNKYSLGAMIYKPDKINWHCNIKARYYYRKEQNKLKPSAYKNLVLDFVLKLIY